MNNLDPPNGQMRELPMTWGEYSNCVNVLVGLLKSRGLRRRARTVPSLDAYAELIRRGETPP